MPLVLTGFLHDQRGGVTIDWVSLTAGILLLGIAVVYGIFTAGVTRQTTQINALLAAELTPPTLTAPNQSDFE